MTDADRADEEATTLAVSEDDLYELYGLLANATDAAALGDPNECAAKAAEARKRVLDIHDEADEI